MKSEPRAPSLGVSELRDRRRSPGARRPDVAAPSLVEFVPNMPSSSQPNRRARLLAFYLPQFHPIPENDEWWGNGFTEWTNVAKARPLFKGHYQPRLPADLGFYDLRVPEVREAQAALARNAGIEGFCYYHYWFAGKRLLERPFKEVVASGKPDFPFCLCWANQSWTGIWHGTPGRVLIEQTYPGLEDNRKHFLALLDAFLDPRHVRVDGRPVFVLFRPNEFPEVGAFIRQWQELARLNGLPGLHFVAHLFHYETAWDYRAHGFDSCVVVSTLKFFTLSMRDLVFGFKDHGLPAGEGARSALATRGACQGALRHALWRRYRAALGKFNQVVLYRHAHHFLLAGCSEHPEVYPCVTPNWDNTARSKTRGIVLHESTPALFDTHFRNALGLVQGRPWERRLVFIKSWNEWAEGNYLEPDQRFGHDYLNVVKEAAAGTP